MGKFAMPEHVDPGLEQGEVDKLFRAIVKFSDRQTARDITYGVDLPSGSTKEQRAYWVRSISEGLENCFDSSTVKAIRIGCHCDEHGRLDRTAEWLRGLYLAAGADLDSFVAAVNERGAGWFIEDRALYTKMFVCECPMLEGIDVLQTKTWCYCTAGYNETLFQLVFDYEVEVEVLQSIKMGGDICLLRVTKKM